MSDTEILAVLGGGKSGDYVLNVVKKGYGIAPPVSPKVVEFKYEVIFDSVTPKQASPQGGVVLTL